MRNFFIDDCEAELDIRLQLLRLQLSAEMGDFEMASDLLDLIHTYFAGAMSTAESIHLANQMHCNLVDRSIIASEIELVKCLRLLQHHQTQPDRQSTLEMLLTHRQCNFESKYLSVFQQFEMLVEWHWHAEQFAKCLDWCENGLYEVMRSLELDRKHHIEYSEHIHFLATYLQHLFDANNQYGLCKYRIYFWYVSCVCVCFEKFINVFHLYLLR